MKRNVIWGVVITNLFAIALRSALSFQQYRAEAKLSQLLGVSQASLLRHGNSLVGPAIMIAVLLCGIVLELRATKAAIFVNLGFACFLLVMVLTVCVEGWHQNPQEVQIVLILVALPLLAVSTLYAILYRRNFTQSRHRASVPKSF